MSLENDQLGVIITDLALIVAQGEDIFVKAGGSSENVTVGQIEAIGETDHLKTLENSGGRLWLNALPIASQLCQKNEISETYLRKVYAKHGIFSQGTMGAVEVAKSIVLGESTRRDNYYPIGHLRGMLAALESVNV